jgi:hypothetical protein
MRDLDTPEIKVVLAERLPSTAEHYARIVTGYNADAVFWGRGEATAEILEDAKSLLASLIDKRSRRYTQQQ